MVKNLERQTELVPIIPIDPNIIFRDLYYKPYGYYQTAEKLLEVARKEGHDFNINDARNFLYKQAVWQIYAPRPKNIPRTSFNQITIPNEVHQADILFTPHDTINGKTYKYCLSVIDIASRFKAGEPLLDKSSSSVAKAFTRIYNSRSCPLVWPKFLQVDGGSEFKGVYA